MLSPPWFNRQARTVATLVLALVLVRSASIANSPNAKFLQISRDPYTGIAGQHASAVEPDTFAAGSTIVSAFQVGRFFDEGAANIGFATSPDGGHSWRQGLLPGTTPYSSPAGKVYGRTSDPTVAFDAKHGV